MTALFAYFERVQALIKGLSGVEIERYEEQILSQERGNLRVRLRFTDNSLLEISEAIHVKNGTSLAGVLKYDGTNENAAEEVLNNACN